MHTSFNSVQEASRRWIAEGKSFKDQLNDWLDIIYIDRQNPETPCPEETRKDMGTYVMEQIVEHNRQGNTTALRELFPPDNDPMNWQGVSDCVSQVAFISKNRLGIVVGEWYQNRAVFIAEGNTIAFQEDIFMFGKSADKKYFAKAYADRIDVTEGWDGPIKASFKPPVSYGPVFKQEFPDVAEGLAALDFQGFQIHQIVVFPTGDRIAIAGAKGIFVLDSTGAQFILTEAFHSVEEEAEDGGFTLGLHYPHVDVSPDGRYIAAGSQSSAHLVFEEVQGTWTEITSVEPRASYPNLARFHNKIAADNEVENSGPQLLLCSCHFSRSASIALPVSRIAPGFSASGYDADDTLNYVNDSKWVFSAGLYSWGYALGSNDGYIWFKTYNGYQYGYLHVGGTVMDIDYSEDRRQMVVASYNGQVIIYDCEQLFADGSLFRDERNREVRRVDDFAITNTVYKDVKRYLFWKGYEPLVW